MYNNVCMYGMNVEKIWYMLICKFNWCVHTYIHTVHIAGRYRFVSERARSGHDSDLPLLVYVSGHDADLALARLDDARAVRADQAALALLPQQILHLQAGRQADKLKATTSITNTPLHLSL
jgi:hypothetical protein